MTDIAVKLEHISKRFPGVRALHDVSLEIAAGSCHALCGENGAGKSTLGKLVAGLYAPDSGKLVVSGREVHFAGARDGIAAGVAMVHQELAFCDNLSVAENLCLGAMPSRRGFVDRAEMMIGRPLAEYYPSHDKVVAGDEVLRAEGLTAPAMFENVSLTLRAGEVVGLAGLMGAGRSEVAGALFGLAPLSAGTISLKGMPVHFDDPREAIRAGIGLVPEDRKRQGLVPSQRPGANPLPPTPDRVARFTLVLRRNARQQASTRLC